MSSTPSEVSARAHRQSARLSDGPGSLLCQPRTSSVPVLRVRTLRIQGVHDTVHTEDGGTREPARAQRTGGRILACILEYSSTIKNHEHNSEFRGQPGHIL